jgi:hypothetical protein
MIDGAAGAVEAIVACLASHHGGTAHLYALSRRAGCSAVRS